MAKSIPTMTLLCAASLALSGCLGGVSKTAGAGFSSMTPSRETRLYIFQNDPPFARQVVAHNEMCAKTPACRKQ